MSRTHHHRKMRKWCLIEHRYLLRAGMKFKREIKEAINLKEHMGEHLQGCSILQFSNYNKMKNEEQKTDNQQGNEVLADVTNRYLFWFEVEGKEGWTFEIEAKDYEEAYEKAYETHGLQVEGMMYQLL